MPAIAIANLQPRFFVDSGSGGISATAIGLIIGVGVVPVFLLIWVVVWLLFFYGNNRTCCCTRRRKPTTGPEMFEQRVSTDTIQATMLEKPVYDLPQRPLSTARTESGGSRGSGRLSKMDPRMSAARFSMQSNYSNSAAQVAQEPKPFV